jgi:hypothetical protein
MKQRLGDVATVVRSKNAGPFELTLDVMFEDRAVYEAVRDGGIFTAEAVARLYRIELQDVLAVIHVDAANAVKVTLRRRLPAGSPGDTDVYGAQQHAPLLMIELDLP